MWRVKGSEIELRFVPCGGGACAEIETSKSIKADPDVRDLRNHDPKLRGRRLKGVSMLQDLRPAGDGWKGRVYWPPAGSTYDLTLRPSGPDTLIAKGCAAPLLCQTNTLVRLP